METVVICLTLFSCWFFFSSKYYHQSYWHSMVYVQPVPPASSVEAYPAYTEPAHVLDHSVPQLYDAGRAEVHQVPLDAPTNGWYLTVRPHTDIMKSEIMAFLYLYSIEA